MESKPPAPESASPPAMSSILLRLTAVDTAVSGRLYAVAQPILPRPLLKTLEISGDGRLFFPVAISLLLSPLSSASPTLRFFIANLIIGGILDLLLIGLIKQIVRRPRPVYNKGMFLTFAVDHWSFPSGHSSRVCFVAAFLYLSSAVIGEGIAQLRSARIDFVDRWLGLVDEGNAIVYIVLLVCSWATTTSVSRIFLGRHFVFDVVAGACLGILEANIVFHFLNCSVLTSAYESWNS
ncbi:probable lipid phosphate phosphatase beta [Impatiens glandulifera]|uniref:probable lipid phosphate phosphatase beta n=1 Tax=Impatiens glandulifera TaxID=253017 RepID=UPI001FB0837A|nr:probable lipid phosphate phosphatase beta [Impatiens glandulifera]